MFNLPKLEYYQDEYNQLTSYRYPLNREVGVKDYVLVSLDLSYSDYRYLNIISNEGIIDQRTPIFDQREGVRLD